MDYLVYAKRLSYLFEMIRKGRLQSPKELEIKFNCSERTIRRMINHLRDLGIEVEYCRKKKKYLIDSGCELPEIKLLQ